MLRLTLPKIGLSVVVAAVIAFVISTVLDRGDRAEDNPVIVHSVMSNNTADQAPLGLQAAQYDEIPGPGALFMIQGQQARQLVFWPLYGDHDPEVIDSKVSANTLRPDPTGTRVLYSTEGALMALDVDARRADIIGVLPAGSYPIRAQWSPTGHAVAYVIKQGTQVFAYYTLADGSQSTIPFLGMSEGLGLDVGWLPDGRPVAIYMGFDPAENRIRAQYALFDPATREFFLLPADSDVIQTWDPWRSPDGTRQIYALQIQQNEEFRQDCLTRPLIVFAEEWLADTVEVYAGEYEVLFELDGLYMDWPTWLQDGRIVFRATADAACETYPSGLYIAQPGDEPEQLVTTAVSFIQDQDENMIWNVVYAINQAETHIAWAENNPETQRSAIYLMPLDGSSPPEMIYQTPLVDDLSVAGYLDDEMIMTLVWLP